MYCIVILTNYHDKDPNFQAYGPFITAKEAQEYADNYLVIFHFKIVRMEKL